MGLFDFLRGEKKQNSKRADGGGGFVNMTTGMGVHGVDKTTGVRFQRKMALPDTLLTDLHSGNDLASLIVDILPDEAMRLGVEVKTGNQEKDAILAREFRRLGVDGKIGDASRWSRLYGGSALVAGFDGGGEPSEPLNRKTIRALSWLRVMDKTELLPNSYNEAGEIVSYMVTPKTPMGTGKMVEVHVSRMFMLDGTKTSISRKVENAGWADSALLKAYDVMADFESAYSNVGTLLADGNQAVFKMSGLANAIAADTSGNQVIQRRFQLMDYARSVYRAMVLDAGDSTDPPEEFERQTAQFSGLGDLLEKFMLRLSAMTRIPVTVLMGQSPAGLSATGESDFRGWYNYVAGYQANTLSPAVEWIAGLLGADDCKVVWPDLWTPSALEQAQTRQANATADKTYIDAGVYSPDEVYLMRHTAEGYQNTPMVEQASIDLRREIVESERTYDPDQLEG